MVPSNTSPARNAFTGGDTVDTDTWTFDFGASNCSKQMYTKLRIACADSILTNVRYIDINKNIFAQGLANGIESGLISTANFDMKGSNAISYNASNAVWRFVNTTQGCDETHPSLIVNLAGSCGMEAANCFGLNLGGASRQFLIYVAK